MNANLSISNDCQYAFVSLMDKAGVELCRVLETNLFRHAGMNWWAKNVLGVLNTDEQQKIHATGNGKLHDLDIHLLLKVLERNYSFLKGKVRLPPEGRDLIYEVRQIRNRCIGHRPVRGQDPERLSLDIQTMERFCITILASPLLAKEFKALTGAETHPDLTPKPTTAPVTPACSSLVVSAKQPINAVVAKPVTIHLASMFTGIDLTASQKQAMEGLEAFLQDDRQDCFVLKGYAGTGKTFLIGGIVKYLTACHKTTVLMAPTGRAAHVMKERHKNDAGTIHRQIYGLGGLKEYKEIGEDGDITFKFYFELRNNDTQHDTIFIVDEASMLSDVYTEAEFMRFGSGRLLRDLLEYINFDGNDYRKKIIFVGDSAQLPPVDMNFSPALDEAYLEKYMRSKVASAELTHVVRQKEGDAILQNATTLRDMLTEKNFASFDFKSDGQSVTETQPDQFIPHYLKHIDSAGTATSVIVGYSNAIIKDYNTEVRKHLFPNGHLLEPGDRVMLVKNSYRHEIELFNGQMGTVSSVAHTAETRSVYLNVGLDENGKRKNIQVVLTFRDATIRFESLDGTQCDIVCKYIEDILSSPHRELSSDQSKSLYVDFKQRHPHLFPGSKSFCDMLLVDPYFNALQLKYAYAVTCHKAQGGEWPTVYVDFQSQNKLDPMAIRWSYTALTRAARNVVATNALHHHSLTPLRKRASIAVLASQISPGSVEQTLPSVPMPDFVSEESAIHQQIYARLSVLLPAGFSINSLTVRPYLSQWSVSKDTCSCLVKVHYSGRNKITDVRSDSASPGEWIKPLQAAVQQLNNVQLAVTAVDEPQSAPVLDKKHGSFFIDLNARCVSLNIRVLSIEHLTDFHSRCTLETGGTIFCVNYYFDETHRFTSYSPDTGLLDRLRKIIDSVHSGQQKEN